MTDHLSFYVAGVAVPQGSKKAFMAGGKPRIVDQSGESLRAWRGRVAHEAQAARPADWPNNTKMSYRVSAFFVMARPDSVPWHKRICPTIKPDVDKTGRAILDALTGVLFPDDCQVCGLGVYKDYQDNMDDEAKEPGAYINVHADNNTAPKPKKVRA